MTITDNAADNSRPRGLTGTGQDFSVAPPSDRPLRRRIRREQTASYNLRRGTGSRFKRTLAFTCAGSPSEATYSVYPCQYDGERNVSEQYYGRRLDHHGLVSISVAAAQSAGRSRMKLVVLGSVASAHLDGGRDPLWQICPAASLGYCLPLAIRRWGFVSATAVVGLCCDARCFLRRDGGGSGGGVATIRDTSRDTPYSDCDRYADFGLKHPRAQHGLTLKVR